MILKNKNVSRVFIPFSAHEMSSELEHIFSQFILKSWDKIDLMGNVIEILGTASVLEYSESKGEKFRTFYIKYKLNDGSVNLFGGYLSCEIELPDRLKVGHLPLKEVI